MVYDLTPPLQAVGKDFRFADCIPVISPYGAKEKISPAGDSHKIL